MKSTLTIIVLFLTSQLAHASQWLIIEHSESPYFEIKGGTINDFHLLDTQVKVDINGIIAEVTVIQSYENNGDEVIEAKYLFPSSPRAAVHNLKLQINDRDIQAKIKPKDIAKKEYKEAIQEGKTAALLEQERPNLFSFAAGNILPDDKIKVELKYTEYLSSFEGEYNFYFPVIVGPRYGSSKIAGISNSAEQVSIQLNVQSGSNIYEPTINWQGSIDSLGTQVKVTTLQTEKSTEDFKFSYRLSDLEFAASVITYQGETENYFLAMVQPPQSYSENNILPQDYILVMDVSGSMAGAPLEMSKKLMRSLLSRMKPDDRFNVVQFAGGSASLFRSNQAATSEKISQALDFVEQPAGGGGTEVLPALERAFNLLSDQKKRATNVVLITDGLVDVEREVFDIVRQYRDKANVFTFGTQVDGYNHYLFDGIANAAGTIPFIINDEKDEKYLKEFSQYLSTPLLTNLQIDFNGLNSYHIYPSKLQDVYSQRPLIVMGKYKGRLPDYFEFSGISGNGLWRVKAPVKKQSFGSTEAVKYLWAREKIRLLDDYQKIDESSKTKEIITQIGLKYNLLTRYTSFIAVDEQVRTTPAVEQIVVVGSRVSSGAADDDMDFDAVRLTDESDVTLNFWGIEENNWLKQCSDDKQLLLGENTSQWEILKDELPQDFNLDNMICLAGVTIRIIPNSNQVIEQFDWIWIEEALFD